MAERQIDIPVVNTWVMLPKNSLNKLGILMFIKIQNEFCIFCIKFVFLDKAR